MGKAINNLWFLNYCLSVARPKCAFTKNTLDFIHASTFANVAEVDAASFLPALNKIKYF